VSPSGRDVTDRAGERSGKAQNRRPRVARRGRQRQHLLEHRAALAGAALGVPPLAQGRRQFGGAKPVTAADQPVQRRAPVVLLRGQLAGGLLLVTAEPQTLGSVGELDAPVGVALAQRRLLTGLAQLLQRVEPDRLKQPVARATVGGVRHDERPLGE
jgi:hypothetical protein